MQGFKKTLVALLAVTMVLSLVGTAFAAIPEDVAGTKYEDAAVRLMALGVFKGDDKGNFNPDAQITRAEAVAIIVRALGLEQSAELMKGVTKFADVNADPGLQWATGVINIAVSAGIVDGYPNGQFGGRDPVKYEELAKMILYALNYGITVEGGVWPTAVLAKSDELGVLDGINVVAGAPIIRGLAAKMLDNSLDVASLKQTGYGDLKTYEDTGKTFLEMLGYEEIEGRVVAIPAVKSALDDDEVEIGDDVYTVLEGVDVFSLFGLKVKAWVNDDDEVVFVQKKTADKDIYVDSVVSKDGQKVKLLVLDDNVTFADEYDLFINNEKAKVKELNENYYGRFVKEKDKVVFGYVFNFGSNSGVVTEVSGETIKYFGKDDTEKKLELKKADSYELYNADFTAASLEDIVVDSVINWWRDGDDYYVMAVNDKVEGTLKKAANDKVTVDGKSIKTGKILATYSLDDDEEVDVYTEAENVADLIDEEVVVLLDLAGRARHIRGDAKATSGTMYGIAVDAYRSGTKYCVKVFTKDGEEVEYPFEKRADWQGVDDPIKAGNAHVPVQFKLNSDGEIAEGTYKELPFGEVVDEGNVIEEAVGDVVTVRKFNDKDDYIAQLDIDDKEEAKYYISDKTVIMKYYADTDDDPEVVAWKDIKGTGTLSAADAVTAIVVGEGRRDAKFVAFYADEFDEGIATEDYYYGVVVGDPMLVGSDKYEVEVDVFGEGVQPYILGDSDNKASVKKGAVIAFNIDAKGKIKASPVVFGLPGKVEAKILTVAEPHTGKVLAYQDAINLASGRKYVSFGNSDDYRLASNAVVYEFEIKDEKGKLVNAKVADDVNALEDNDFVVALVDAKKDQVRALAFLRTEEAPEPPTEYKLSDLKKVVGGIEVTVTLETEDDSDDFAVRFLLEGEFKGYGAISDGKATFTSNDIGVWTAELVETAKPDVVLATISKLLIAAP